MITIRRTFAFVFIFLFCFLTCSCSQKYDNTNTGNMVSKRSFLHKNGLIITALPIKNGNTKSSISNHTYYSEITRPNIVGLKNPQIQAAINKEIYENCNYVLRIRLESCGFYLSLVKNVGSENMIARNFNAVSRCFDIRTGNEIKLKDLFKEGYVLRTMKGRTLVVVLTLENSQRISLKSTNRSP